MDSCNLNFDIIVSSYYLDGTTSINSIVISDLLDNGYFVSYKINISLILLHLMFRIF